MLKKQELKKGISKEDNSYFIVLLKRKDLLFISWRIDDPEWKKKIETAESDPETREYLYIDQGIKGICR